VLLAVTWNDVLDWVVGTPLKIVLTLLVAAAANRVIRRALLRTGERLKHQSNVTGRLMPAGADDPRLSGRIDTLINLSRNVVSITIWTIAWLLVLGTLGVNLAPLIAGAGIAGIAIGFGAQQLVRDVISGFFMLAEDQYGIGDDVDILPGVGAALMGTVEGITLRKTSIRGVDGTLWHVANGEIRRVGNRSQQWARVVLDVRVRLDADIGEATKAVLSAARDAAADPAFQEHVQGEPEVWGVEQTGMRWVVLRLAVRTDPQVRGPFLRALRAKETEALAAADLLPPA
jgi:small conductance mechanosensitive channel